MTSPVSEIEKRLKKLERTKITIIGKGRGPKKKSGNLWSFTTPGEGGEGGSSRVMKKPYCFFKRKRIFFFFREDIESF